MTGHRRVQVLFCTSAPVTPMNKNTTRLVRIDGTVGILQVNRIHLECRILKPSHRIESRLDVADRYPRHKAGQGYVRLGFRSCSEILSGSASQHWQVIGLLYIRRVIGSRSLGRF